MFQMDCRLLVDNLEMVLQLAKKGCTQPTVSWECMATFSTGERKKSPKGDKRSTETLLILRTFEAAILFAVFFAEC